MTGFRLTRAAEADLKEIGKATLERWGRRQRNTYLRELDEAFRRIA